MYGFNMFPHPMAIKEAFITKFASILFLSFMNSFNVSLQMCTVHKVITTGMTNIFFDAFMSKIFMIFQAVTITKDFGTIFTLESLFFFGLLQIFIFAIINWSGLAFMDYFNMKSQSACLPKSFA